jgi:hypothetical protein
MSHEDSGFVTLRREIEARLEFYVDRVLPDREYREIEQKINQLQALAIAEQTGAVAPPNLRLPVRPIAPPLPPIPKLPEPVDYQAKRDALHRRLIRLQFKRPKFQGNRGQATRSTRETELFKQQIHGILEDMKRAAADADLRLQYDKAKAAHELVYSRLRIWEQSVAVAKHRHQEALKRWEADPRHRFIKIKYHAVRRLQEELEMRRKGYGGSVRIIRVPWRLLPAPEPGERGLIRTLDEIRRAFPNLKFEEERLRFAYGLNPVCIYVGQGDFDGYLAFHFSAFNNVLLECPIKGNAAYVFKNDWQKLSKLSKGELLSQHRQEVGRVIHHQYSSWQALLKSLLRS